MQAGQAFLKAKTVAKRTQGDTEITTWEETIITATKLHRLGRPRQGPTGSPSGGKLYSQNRQTVWAQAKEAKRAF